MIGEGDVLAAFKVVPLSQVVPLYRWSDTSCGHPEPCAVSASTAALVMLPQYLRLSDVSLLHPEARATAAASVMWRQCPRSSDSSCEHHEATAATGYHESSRAASVE